MENKKDLRMTKQYKKLGDIFYNSHPIPGDKLQSNSLTNLVNVKRKLKYEGKK